ncbi:MAG: chromate resistance protein [Verrucomicrobiaceae bacterium]|nr:chromate resistance protein [Verrucomicrobiaceae bacterium]
MTDLSWLLLLYGLSSKHGAARLALWRQLKRLGAVSLKTSAYVLPDRPELYESFQWLAQRVREQGGDATIVRAADVDGVSDAELVQMFQHARAEDYAQIIEEARPLMPSGKKGKSKASAEDIEKIAARFEAVKQVDYFDCPKSADVEHLLQRLSTNTALAQFKTLTIKQYQGRTWLTRPRPEVDRVGSAWLIQRFIDPKAAFIFASEPRAHPEALPYDMPGVEFGHHGDDCTFETLVKRFAIEDSAVMHIGKIIHDADLSDGRYGTTEGAGLLAIFRGWAHLGWSDHDILARGFDCFEALHRQFTSRGRKR